MNQTKILLLSLLSLCSLGVSAQELWVETIANLDASGGVTFGPDGNVYVSDFGPSLGTASSNTSVYRLEYGTWEISEFAIGFTGASGARFDSQGNFYQSNPSGGRVSKRSPDGNVNYNWATNGLFSPIGITNDAEENLYVCNCGNNTIQKITPNGTVSLFASSSLFNCPNGITIDPEENLYVCNFNDGRILKITPQGNVSSFYTLPSLGGVGNGHLTYANGFLFVATIGVGQIFKLSLDGEAELIAGIAQGFSNEDGPALQATFSKPNGLAASITGDTLWVNCSVPTWQTSNLALHPGRVRMITGVCSLSDVECPLLTSNQEVLQNGDQQWATFAPLSPNPVKGMVSINFTIQGHSQETQLEIVNAKQQVVKTLWKGKQAVGAYHFSFDSNDLAAGSYFLVLKNKTSALTQRMLVVY